VDDRDRLVDAFSQKRERLNEQARRQRETRDRLNDGTKAHAQRRDELNAQVRGLVEQANGHRARRDALNQQVREAKVKRDELNHEAHAKAEALHALRRGRGHEGAGVSAAKLKAEIRQLEYQQQTTVLSPQKEKALIELIGAKLKELKAREGEDHVDAEMQGVSDAARVAKEAAEAQHAHVTHLANEAQAAHEAMAGLFAQADAIRKEADAAQAEFVKSKVEADKVHRHYIGMVGSVRDLERVLGALRLDAQGQPTVSQSARAEADEIFDKFRKGEKLSTEDLMALQKAGRL
jgi:uncharacterized coiled-coil DUF342 family protein